MKWLTAIALLAAALGALMHFWGLEDRPTIVAATGESASGRDAVGALPGGAEPMHAPAAAAVTSGRAAGPAIDARPRVGAVMVEIRAPDTVRTGDVFPLSIDVQAQRGIRSLDFSVSYKKSILQLVGSSPGAWTQQGVTAVQVFEEPSDGYLQVRVELQSGVLAGSGSVAVLEFQATRRGVSPLSVHGISYVEGGRQDTATSEDYEGSITVH